MINVSRSVKEKYVFLTHTPAVVDPDLQIRREGGHSDPEIRGGGAGGGAVSKKIFLGPLGLILVEK